MNWQEILFKFVYLFILIFLPFSAYKRNTFLSLKKSNIEEIYIKEGLKLALTLLSRANCFEQFGLQ